MNVYKIRFRFAGGPELTVEKEARTERCAKQALYAQIGNSSRLEILGVERMEEGVHAL
jgi:hypothetical protein